MLQVGKLRHTHMAAAAPRPGCFPTSGPAGVGAQLLPPYSLFGFLKAKSPLLSASLVCGAARVPRAWGGSSDRAAQGDASMPLF